MVAQNGETANRASKFCQDGRHNPWGYSSAAEELHVNVIAPVQHEVGT